MSNTQGLAKAWLREQKIHTLNVAGPRASQVPVAYQVARKFMGEVLTLYERQA